MDFFDFNESLGLTSTLALDPIDRSKLPMIAFPQSTMLNSGIAVDTQSSKHSIKLDDNVLDDPMIQFIPTPVDLVKPVVKDTTTHPPNTLLKQSTDQTIKQTKNPVKVQTTRQPVAQPVRSVTSEAKSSSPSTPIKKSAHQPPTAETHTNSPSIANNASEASNTPASNQHTPSSKSPAKSRKPRQKLVSAPKRTSQRKNNNDNSTVQPLVAAVNQQIDPIAVSLSISSSINQTVTQTAPAIAQISTREQPKRRTTRSKKQPVDQPPTETPPVVKLIAPTRLSAPVVTHSFDPRAVRLAGEKRARDFLSKKGKGAKKAKTTTNKAVVAPVNDNVAVAVPSSSDQS